mgnify:FL=1
MPICCYTYVVEFVILAWRHIITTTIDYMKAHRAWQGRYDTSAPKVGDLAPDFELYDVNGANSVQLSDFQGHKPVALVFGSFT